MLHQQKWAKFTGSEIKNESKAYLFSKLESTGFIIKFEDEDEGKGGSFKIEAVNFSAQEPHGIAKTKREKVVA